MSREMPYRPDPKPAPPSFDHMQTILAKHLPKQLESKVDVQPKPQRDPAKLVWRKVSDFCIESTCGRFQIQKRGLGEPPYPPSRFQYWCYKRTPEWFHHFDTKADPQAARQACEAVK
jgi:hypothetical protein